MKIQWMSDLHLDHMAYAAAERFIEDSAAEGPDLLAITGDIADASSLGMWLKMFARVYYKTPIVFVLGNHDFYNQRLGYTHMTLDILTREHKHLHYLEQRDKPLYLPQFPAVAICGANGWGDGPMLPSAPELNDWSLIHDFQRLDEAQRDYLRMSLSQRSAASLQRQLDPVVDSEITSCLILSHVPLDSRLCLYEGKQQEPAWLSHFYWHNGHEVLLEHINRVHFGKQCHYTVLAGHTHHMATLSSANMTMMVASAQYKKAGYEVFDLM